MTPKKTAVIEISLLLQKVIKSLPLVPRSMKKKLLERCIDVAEEIMNISEQYVTARLAEQYEATKEYTFTGQPINTTSPPRIGENKYCGICSHEIYPNYLCKCEEYNLR